MAILEMDHIAYLSIGSNMGDRPQNCCQGIQILCSDDRISLIAQSPFYETEPVGYTDQEWFLNGVFKIQTDLAPLDLMFKTQAVQKRVGRRPGGIRFGPRILDLDIIFYDDYILDSPQLTIPHKRMHKRRFVLQPICDIDPDIMHPVLRQKVKRLLDQLEDEGQGIKPWLAC